MNTLLVVDDEKSVRYSFTSMFEDEYRILTAGDGSEALDIFEKEADNIDVVFLDVRMPGLGGIDVLKKMKEKRPSVPVVIMTAFSDSDTAIEAMKEGAFDYLVKPFYDDRLKDVIEKAIASSRLQHEAYLYNDSKSYPAKAETLVGKSRAIVDVCKLIGQAAVTDVPVLISGESGTGKELVARAIYNYSGRKGRTFLAVNCAALPEGVMESELFGCEKGAFTGAEQRRIGRFEQCDGGVIFLDEIGDMSLSAQSKLLRVLQDSGFERLGSNRTIKTNVRIIAASNRNLYDEVSAGRFREDLFHRLNVFPINIPPLRERKEDIPALTEYFITRTERHTGRHIKGIASGALELLMSYGWPGNVRELENVIRRAAVVVKSDIIGANDINLGPAPHREDLQELARAVHLIWDRVTAGKNSSDIFYSVISSAEKILIEKALSGAKGNKARAASMLGITRVTLRKKMQEYNIPSE
ncbi:MAG: sigma-54-dependent Fis family transcriptional regulator [Nitrospirae bacterium]|nr:sigma-54-dependent Fis family transcriptional regulator [Nitrospirota bacterium]